MNFVPGHVMRCDNELQDINAKVRKNESATAQFEISQNRNFQKKTKPLEPQNLKEWFDAKTYTSDLRRTRTQNKICH